MRSDPCCRSTTYTRTSASRHRSHDSYPQITDIGFAYFIDALSKFLLRSVTISLGTSEMCTTINISDAMIKKLARWLKSLDSLVEFELNLKK